MNFRVEKGRHNYRVVGTVENKPILLKSVFRKETADEVTDLLNASDGSQSAVVEAFKQAGFTSLPPCACRACEQSVAKHQNSYLKEMQIALDRMHERDLRCVHYEMASDFSCEKRKAIKGIFHYFWTEEDGIGDNRTTWIETCVDDIIRLGVTPNRISGCTIKEWDKHGEESSHIEHLVATSARSPEDLIPIYLPEEKVTIEESDSDEIDEMGQIFKAAADEETKKYEKPYRLGDNDSVPTEDDIPFPNENDDPPEQIGPTFKAICPFQEGLENEDVVDGIWKLIQKLSETCVDMDFSKFPFDKTDIVITVDYEPRKQD